MLLLDLAPSKPKSTVGTQQISVKKQPSSVPLILPTALAGSKSGNSTGAAVGPLLSC